MTEEIIQIISKFKGVTATYVNDRAFSAGAFIAVATQKIYMAPQSVIGAAAPILMSPTGTGADKMPDTVEAKMTSAVRAGWLYCGITCRMPWPCGPCSTAPDRVAPRWSVPGLSAWRWRPPCCTGAWKSR